MSEYTQCAKIVEGPHVMHTGVDGTICACITVEALEPKPGRMVRWNINTFTMHTNTTFAWAEYLGIGVEEVDKIRSALKQLEA